MSENYFNYYLAYEGCNDQGKKNLLKVVNEEVAVMIFTLNNNYTSIEDNYLQKHYNAITEDLAAKHGKKFSKKLISIINKHASNKVKSYIMLTGRGENFGFMYFSKDILLKLASKSQSPYIRYCAAYHYFDRAEEPTNLFFLNNGDYAAICHAEADIPFIFLTTEQIFELLFCSNMTPDLLRINGYKIKTFKPECIIQAVENIESYKSFTAYNKHVMKAFLIVNGVMDKLTNNAADKFVEALGNEVPQEVFDKASDAAIKDTLKTIAEEGSNRDYNSFFVRVMERNPKLVGILSIRYVRKLKYSVIKKYEEEILKAVRKFSEKDAKELKWALNTDIEEVFKKLNKGFELLPYEILRLELKE